MQERLYRLEQHAGIVSSPPPLFVSPRDPLALYDEACAAYEDETSRPHGKGKATEDDEEYIEEDDDEDDGGGDDDDQDEDDDFDDE